MDVNRQNIENIFPLTPMQEGLLFHALADTGSAAYFQQTAWHLRGVPDREAFANAWNEMVRRHGILRTVFVHTETERPLQVVLKERRLEVEELDLRDRNEREQREQRAKLKEADRRQGFDLSRDALLRIKLLRLNEAECEVVFSHHHILLDGWSLGLLFREWLDAYRALRAGRRPTFSAVPPFNVYVKWLESRSMEESGRFWREYLRDCGRAATPPTNPFNRTEDAAETTAEYAEVFQNELMRKLQATAAELRVTPSTMLQCLWGLLLARYHGEEDATFGAVVSGRPPEISGVERMVGNFINLIPVRLQPHAELTFAEYAAQTQQQALAAVPHHYYPPARLRTAGFSPHKLFGTVTAYENYPLDVELKKTLDPGEFGFEILGVESFERTHYDFDLQFLPEGDALRVKMTCNPLVYEQEQMARTAGHLRIALSAVVENSRLRLAEVPWLTDAERKQEVFGFNSTPADPSDKNETLVSLFEDQASRTPERTAVVCGDERRTYAELNRNANRHAHYLHREAGVGPGDTVGLLLGRSTSFVEALLGVLKAGGAYLPLDPRHPPHRLARMLHDADAKAVLTREDVLRALPGGALLERYAPIEPIYTSPRTCLRDLDQLPHPDRSLVNYEAYHRHIGQATVRHAAAIQATRGCPYECAYCHKLWPKGHARRSVESLLEEVRRLLDCGVRRFVFIDDIFNLHRADSRRFFEEILRRNWKCQFFFSNGLRGDILSHEEIDLMVEAGTVQAAFALETAVPRLQRLIRKNLDVERLRDTLEYIAAKHPQVILELFTMHGFPTETEDEARQTLEFIKSIRWLHFPYVFVLRIFPDTEMARLALEHGVSRRAIEESADLGYHELPTTLPFPRRFSTQYQMEFLNEYFLSKERLLHVLPRQKAVLTESELTQKYNSYLPAEINAFDDVLKLAGIRPAELNAPAVAAEAAFHVPDLNRRHAAVFPQTPKAPDALRVLLLDLSQTFSTEKALLYDVVEPPLGLMYLLTTLNREFGSRVTGRIAKARIDFDDFDALRRLLTEFKPDLIGLRSLTFYQDFFHKTTALIRQWGFASPIITGGPYATSDTTRVLRDPEIALAVLGEGEQTLVEIVTERLRHPGLFEDEERLRCIAGIAFVPPTERRQRRASQRLLSLDRVASIPDEDSSENPPAVNAPDDPAYLIYTSGSTGVPKGVPTAHRAVVNLMHWLKTDLYARFDGPIREALTAPFIFDVSVQQLFGCLTHGHTCHVMPDEVRTDARRLDEELRRCRADMANFTPGFFELLLEAAADREPWPMRLILVGAEPLTSALLEKFFQRPENRAVAVRNMYGPTECCVDATSIEFTAENRRRYRTPPLGRPVSGIQAYVLDEQLRPVPLGVPGELCLAGVGLACGYRNDPAATAERFVPHPFAAKKQLYRTGDRVCRWADGNLEFLGRVDRQVKLHGYRIETGEIESRLNEHPLIRAAAVLAVEEDGRRELRAWYVGREELDAQALRAHLRRSLPDYMLPARFVRLDKIPLTSAGKVDRATLPTQGGAAAQSAAVFEPPRPGVETILADVWQNVLGVPRVGRHDDYFELGGDSIKAVRASSRLLREGYKLELRDLFRYPTVGALAPQLTRVAESRRKAAAPTGTAGTAPLTAIQARFFAEHTVEPERFNHAPVLFAREGFDERALRTALSAVSQNHEALRLCFPLRNGRRMQEAVANVPLDFQVADLRSETDPGTAFRRRAVELQTGFCLNRAPLMKAALFRLPDGDRLLWVAHHLIVDAVSWRILFEDLAMVYEQARVGRSAALPEETTTFTAWARSVADHARSDELLKEADAWRRMFAVPVPEFPFAGPSAPADYGAVQTQTCGLTAAETDDLLVRSHAAYTTTTEDLLLAAWTAAVWRERNVADFIVLMEGHGRQAWNGLDIERTVGWFTCTYPVRLIVPGEADLARRIREVKETLRRIPNGGFGYGILHWLAPSELRGAWPTAVRPPISFNYLGRFEENPKAFDLEWPELDGTVSPAAVRPTELDLAVAVRRGNLEATLTYNPVRLPPAQARRLMRCFEAELRVMTTHCVAKRSGEATPADLTYSDLTLEEFDGLFAGSQSGKS